MFNTSAALIFISMRPGESMSRPVRLNNTAPVNMKADSDWLN